MDNIFDITSKISTPLALAGLFAAIFFFVVRGIVRKFPSLTKNLSADIIKQIIDRLFILALISMTLGFVGFMLTSSPVRVENNPKPNDSNTPLPYPSPGLSYSPSSMPQRSPDQQNNQPPKDSPAQSVLGEGIKITAPSDGSSVNLSHEIEWRTEYSDLRHYILIKPEGYGSKGFIQPDPKRMTERLWKGQARFGDINSGGGKQYKIRILATQTQLIAGPLVNAPEDAKLSGAITVNRRR